MAGDEQKSGSDKKAEKKPAGDKKEAGSSGGGKKKETGLGLSVKKEENFGEWYSEVVVNADCVFFLRRHSGFGTRFEGDDYKESMKKKKLY